MHRFCSDTPQAVSAPLNGCRRCFFLFLFLVFTGFYRTAIVSSSKNLSSDTSAVPRDSKPVETTCIKLQEHSAGLSRKTVREEPKEPHEKTARFFACGFVDKCPLLPVRFVSCCLVRRSRGRHTCDRFCRDRYDLRRRAAPCDDRILHRDRNLAFRK